MCPDQALKNRSGQLQAAKGPPREEKFQRELQLLYDALKPYLVPKVSTHDRKIVFCETSYYFMVKVVAGSGNGAPVTFLVRPTAFLDHFFESVVEIFALSALGDLCLIVEFDLVDQQAGKALGFAVNVLIGRGDGRCR